LSALTCTYGIPVLCQEYAVDKGSLNLGGTLGFQSAGGDYYNYQGERTTILVLNPEIRYFFFPHIALGLDIGFTSSSQEGSGGHALSLGPALVHFIGGRESDTYPYWGLALLYLHGPGDPKYLGRSQSGCDFRITFGVANMVSSQIAVFTQINYHIQKYERKSGDVIALSVGLGGFIY
jgi:hypothetical protein